MYSRVKSNKYSTVQYSTVVYSIVQYNTIQYIIVQYISVKYSTLQYSTVAYSTVFFRKLGWQFWQGADNFSREPGAGSLLKLLEEEEDSGLVQDNNRPQ